MNTNIIAMNAKIVITTIVMLSLLAPTAYADNGFDIALGDYPFLVASFDNCTLLSHEKIPQGSFTTLHNHTFHWQNASKITYRNNEGRTDYFIIWQCSPGDEYDVLYSMHDLDAYYSDYANDNKSVVFMEIPKAEDVYGILLDTQNISYTEEDLVHGILGLFAHGLTNSGYQYNAPIDVHDASPKENYYSNYKSEQWDMAINDPDWYYDHYDYGDDGDIDEYLYEYHFW